MMLPSRTSSTAFSKSLILSTLITAVSSISQSASADSVYGPVKSSDTLSKIIRSIYTGPSSSYRTVMKQIVIDNPRAFQNGDMNLLKLNASLTLRGNLWKNAAQSITPSRKLSNTLAGKSIAIDSVDRSAPELTVEQMKGRIIFLDAERSSLIVQVTELKRGTIRLEKKIQSLEASSQQSDEQLRTLDAEIIRLSNLLSNKNDEIKISSTDQKQLVMLQEKLRLLQRETAAQKRELENTKKKLGSNDSNSKQTNQTIAQLTSENNKLQKMLQDAQPGVHYYNDTASEPKVSLLAGKLQLPIGLLAVGGVLLAIMLIALIATKRKKKQPEVIDDSQGLNPFEITPNFNNTQNFNRLLETEGNESRGFAQLHTQPEENVFKMFDEGTLEMDLKLDMAEAYLQVFDFESARSILQEVIKGGSELQKRKATRLISKAA